MNRKIKFRAWNTDDNKMEYPLVLAICNDGGTLNFKPLIKCADGNSAYKDYPLMQFTGLHDKNGKDIYEGDIIKPEKWTTAWIVQWDEKKARFNFIIDKERRIYGLLPTDVVEIIGNIYETPELLKP